MSAAILNLVSFSLFAHRDSDKPEKINISLLSGFCGFAYEHCVAIKSGDKNNVPGVRGFGVWGRRSVFGGWVSRHPKKSCVISENFLGQIEQNFSIYQCGKRWAALMLACNFPMTSRFSNSKYRSKQNSVTLTSWVFIQQTSLPRGNIYWNSTFSWRI